LTERELEITDVEDCVALLERLHSRRWSALEVTVAFCKRAAIAQQLINPLMDIDFEGAMKRAKDLDDYLHKEGKLVGPLHGLPISFKVNQASLSGALSSCMHEYD
jgi:amidase